MEIRREVQKKTLRNILGNLNAQFGFENEARLIILRRWKGKIIF